MDGLPFVLPEFAPVQTSSPGPVVSVWFTMTVPKAAKGHGDGSARLAWRIQYALVEYGMPLIVRAGSARGIWAGDRRDRLSWLWDSQATARLQYSPSETMVVLSFLTIALIVRTPCGKETCSEEDLAVVRFPR